MNIRSQGLLVAAALIVVGALWFTASVPGQGPSAVARTEDGKPNLNGIWQAFTTANWNVEAHSAEAGPRPEIMGAYGAQPGGQGIVDGGAIPYKPEALAERDANLKSRMVPKITNDPSRFDSGDPELQCFRPGVPRANYMPFPFQFFQDQNQILMVYEYKWAMRQIHIDPQMEAPVHREGDLPRPREDVRILDRRLVLHVVRPLRRPALDDVQGIGCVVAGPVEPAIAVEAPDVDDERVALPLAVRPAHP